MLRLCAVVPCWLQLGTKLVGRGRFLAVLVLVLVAVLVAVAVAVAVLVLVHHVWLQDDTGGSLGSCPSSATSTALSGCIPRGGQCSLYSAHPLPTHHSSLITPHAPRHTHHATRTTPHDAPQTQVHAPNATRAATRRATPLDLAPSGSIVHPPPEDRLPSLPIITTTAHPRAPLEPPPRADAVFQSRGDANSASHTRVPLPTARPRCLTLRPRAPLEVT